MFCAVCECCGFCTWFVVRRLAECACCAGSVLCAGCVCWVGCCEWDVGNICVCCCCVESVARVCCATCVCGVMCCVPCASDVVCVCCVTSVCGVVWCASGEVCACGDAAALSLGSVGMASMSVVMVTVMSASSGSALMAGSGSKVTLLPWRPAGESQDSAHFAGSSFTSAFSPAPLLGEVCAVSSASVVLSVCVVLLAVLCVFVVDGLPWFAGSSSIGSSAWGAGLVLGS